jgi:hypothetical protein
MDLCNDRFESSRQNGCGFCLSWPGDWRAFLRTRANILVTGPNAALRAFVRAARPEFRAPIRLVVGGRTVVLHTASTLILRNVDRLNRAAQRMLLAWMNEPEHADTQIVSTASAPLFPLVEADGFDRDLYYRLNTIWLEVRQP